MRVVGRKDSGSLHRVRGRAGEGGLSRQYQGKADPDLRGVPGSLKRSRELRHSMSIPERTLWKLLRRKNITGLRFRRQHPLGPYIADFYCHEAAMVVEIDGQSHSGVRKEHDDRRDRWMAERGLTIVRFTASEMTRDPDSVASTILRIIESTKD